MDDKNFIDHTHHVNQDPKRDSGLNNFLRRKINLYAGSFSDLVIVGLNSYGAEKANELAAEILKRLEHISDEDIQNLKDQGVLKNK